MEGGEKDRGLTVTELPTAVAQILARRAAEIKYEPELIESLAKDFDLWAVDIEQARPSEEQSLPEIRVSRYPQLTTPAQFRAAADYLRALAQQHAPERVARLMEERKRAAENPPRFFDADEAKYLAAEAALHSGAILSAEALREALEIIASWRAGALNRITKKPGQGSGESN